LNFISTFGAVVVVLGFLVFVHCVIYSLRFSPRDVDVHVWGVGTTLEGATHTPIPKYSVAALPKVETHDALIDMHEKAQTTFNRNKLDPIHMPSYSGKPFIMTAIMFFASFALVFEWIPVAVIGLVGIIIMMFIRSFDYDDGYHIEVDEVIETEEKARGMTDE